MSLDIQMMDSSKTIPSWNWYMHLSILIGIFLSVRDKLPLKITFLLSNTVHSMIAYQTIDVSNIQKCCSLRNNKEQLSDHKAIPVKKFCTADNRLVLCNIYSSSDDM